MRSLKTIHPVILLLLLLFAGCSQNNSVKVGISIGPGHERWQKDSDYLKESLEKQGARVIIKMAYDSDSLQQIHVKELIDEKVDVLIITPVNSNQAANCVNNAKEKGIKVIAYDRIIKNCDIDFYISFDNVKVGEMQASYLTQIKPTGNYIILGGSPSDDNSVMLHLGQMSVLQPLITKGDIKIVVDRYIAGWNADRAFQVVNNFLSKTKDVDAIIASSDALAEGAFRALEAHGLAGKVLLSGQDAQLDACQRIVNGNQTMTVYKFIERLSYSAANIAMSLASDRPVSNSFSTINNGSKMVPSILLPSMITVNTENIRMTVIADGYLDEDQIFATNHALK